MSTNKKASLSKTEVRSAKKPRSRRKRAPNTNIGNVIQSTNVEAESQPKKAFLHLNEAVSVDQPVYYGPCNCPDCTIIKVDIGTMTNDPIESREKVKAAREAKKLAKQQAKLKRDAGIDLKQPVKASTSAIKDESTSNLPVEVKNKCNKEPAKVTGVENSPNEVKSNDEVDRGATVNKVELIIGEDVNKEQIKAERAAKKAAKQAKKKEVVGDNVKASDSKPNTEMTVRDVIQTLRDIKEVAQELKVVTAQVQALSVDKEPEKKTPSSKQPTQVPTTEEKLNVAESKETNAAKESEESKSKAQLRAERRAKQEAQRAAKEVATQAKAATAKPKEQNTQPSKEDSKTVTVKEKLSKPKSASKLSSKPQGHKTSWFRHLYNEDEKAKLNNLPVNSNLHPAIIKLGVQLATRVVSGSNARCIALLDALKKMVRDYSLPARTEFGRGLEAHLASSLQFLSSMRQPTASQTNAVKLFRHHLTRLPNNVDEFDAKKTLQEEIDRYIHEQIDMAGEAISITVRKKISKDDVILTYGCSSLIERILVEAHASGASFRAVVVGGARGGRAAREMSRRLSTRGVPCLCVDITALGLIMRTVNKVLLGASALLGNGAVLGRAGTAAVALAARAANKPVLVACETHKFSEQVHTTALLYDELGDPDELIDKTDDNSPLKDWRSNQNLTLLNLSYDVTPPNLVTAVVTELAILPCSSAPVVLRFKLSEYTV